jgi:hypothetical protein
LKSAPHSPYSPDLAPSDFALFGDVKRCLADLSFEDPDQLLAAVEGVLEGIDTVTLQAVFLDAINDSGNILLPMGIILSKLK